MSVITATNPRTQAPQAQAPERGRRLAPWEIRERYYAGRKWYHDRYVPPKQFDEARRDVCLYLFMQGHGDGREDERLDLLLKWAHVVRPPRTANDERELTRDCRRLVYWNNGRSDGEPSERYLDRLVARRTWLPWQDQRANEKRAKEAQERIQAALEALVTRGEKITYRSLMAEAKCSHHTLIKYKDLWEFAAARKCGRRITVIADPNHDQETKKRRSTECFTQKTSEIITLSLAHKRSEILWQLSPTARIETRCYPHVAEPSLPTCSGVFGFHSKNYQPPTMTEVCPSEIQSADLSGNQPGVLIHLDWKGSRICNTNGRISQSTDRRHAGSAVLVSPGLKTKTASRCHSPPAPS